MKNNQKGFSVVEGLLIAVILIALVGIGYYVYKAKKNTDNSYNAATTASTSTKSTTKSKATSTPTVIDDKYASANVTGYNTLPADFKPLELAFLKKVDAACKANVAQVSPPLTAGGQVQHVVRDSFITINQQQEDCEGGGIFHYSKVNGVWQFDFTATMTPSCELVNKYSFTKEIIPFCYPDNSSEAIPNTNP